MSDQQPPRSTPTVPPTLPPTRSSRRLRIERPGNPVPWGGVLGGSSLLLALLSLLAVLLYARVGLDARHVFAMLAAAVLCGIGGLCLRGGILAVAGLVLSLLVAGLFVYVAAVIASVVCH